MGKNLIADAQLNRAVANMRQRSERQVNPEKLRRAFVDVGILPQIESTNNQIIFGRRGTGKTHVLKVYEANCRDRGVATVYVDARTFGSSSQFLDPDLPIHQRCNALFKDFLAVVHDSLLDHVILIASNAPSEVLEKLNFLADLLVDRRYRAEPAELTIHNSNSDETSGSFGFNIGLKSGAGLQIGDAEKIKSEKESITKLTVRKEDSVNFPAIGATISSILKMLNTNLAIAIDEWSSIPTDIQPFFAEFIRRSFFANPRVTVKLAALEQRSVFSVHINKDRVGFELSADIGAALDLDDYYVYDRDPEAVVQAFAEMLFRHLVQDLPADFLENAYGVTSARALISSIFAGGSFRDLVRTAEGVARDVIYIFSASFFTARRKNTDQIEREQVLQEARQWFEQDKYQNLGSELRIAFDAIARHLIVKKRSRSFLVAAEDEKHFILQGLLDARVIHLMRRGYIDAETTGMRYSVFNLDYGSYLHVVNDPTYSNDLEIRKLDSSASGKYINPFGDGRSIRRVILPKELLPRSPSDV